ncbi:MAG: dihydroorotate dehydrogenase electron transfer subunit, partial [Methanobacterium sp.]
MHIPRIVKIKHIIEESPTVKTFIFDWEVKDEIPGQFMMVWNFNDEKPMSLSMIDPVKNEIGISIKNIGEFTGQVHRLTQGDKLGLRGPYGRGFHITGSKVLAVGGGIGMAPIVAFSEEASRFGVDVHVISAASTMNELLFEDRIQRSGSKLLTCTDDGTHGFCGYGTDLAEKAMLKEDYDMIVS